jgi:hypothetical protein
MPKEVLASNSGTRDSPLPSKKRFPEIKVISPKNIPTPAAAKP